MKSLKGSKQVNGGYIALEDGRCSELYGGLFDKPLICFGCGIGWLLFQMRTPFAAYFFSEYMNTFIHVTVTIFLIGFLFPITWFAGTILYLTNYSKSDPRERAGLGACASAALICTFIGAVALMIVLFKG